MKGILLSLSLLFVSYVVVAQAAQDGSVRYQKADQPAAVIELPYPPDVVTAAMNEYLVKKGKSRGSDVKGFSTFRNTMAAVNDSVNADLYFKTERKSRQEKQVTVISLLLQNPKEAGVTTSLRPLNMEEAKAYLNDLMPAIEAYNLELEIKEQNEAILRRNQNSKVSPMTVMILKRKG